MKTRHFPNIAFFAAIAVLFSLGLQAFAQTWVPTAVGTGYTWPATANWSPATSPNALGAVANVNNDILGNQTITLGTNVTLGSLNYGDADGSNNFNITAAATNTLTFQGTNAGDATFLTLSTTGTSTNTISAAVVLGGSSSLTVRNYGTQLLTFSGSGGLSVGTNGIILDTSNINSANSILISTALTGTGPLTKNGLGNISLTASATNYAGLVTINSGFFYITGGSSGSIASTSITVNANAQAGVNQGGSALVIGNNSAGIVNRLVDNAVITLNGGGFHYNGSGTAGLNNETIGEIVVGQGNANLTINSGTGKWTEVTMTTLSRSSSGTLQVRGTGLGSTTNTGSTSHIWITGTLPTMIGGGGATGSTTMSILPWAIGGTNPSSENSELITYDSTGLRPLAAAEYSTMALAGTTANVADSVSGVTGDKTINALKYNNGGTTSITAGKTLTLTSGALVFSVANGIIAGGTLNFGSEGMIFSVSANTNTISSVINGSSGITKGGTGVLVLSGANIYTGQTTVSGGVLRAGAANTLPGSTAVVLADTTANTLTGGFINVVTTFDLNGYNQTIGSLAGGGALGGNVSLGSATLTTGGDNSSTTYGGVISGTGALTKAGSGTQTLTGSNTYTGTTTVSAGALIINGDNSAATGSVTVGAAGTLGGSGTIGGATTISGTHSPGTSPGIQTFTDNLTYSGGASSVVWELTANTTSQGSPTRVFDQIVVGGNLDFAGATSLSLSFNFAGSAVDWSNPLWDANITGTSGWRVYDLTAGSLNNFGNLSISNANWADGQGDLFNTARPGSSFSLYQDSNDIYLNYAVPEPSTYAMLALSAVALAGCMIRRRRRD